MDLVNIKNKIKFPFLLVVESLLRIVSPKKSRVYFWSFGKYHDNPKWVSQKLHELSPQTEIFWEIKEGSYIKDIPEYVKIVKEKTFISCYIKNSCYAIVDAGSGYRCFHIKNPVLFYIKRALLRNKKQYDLSTWHGNPIKTFGIDIPENKDWTPLNTFFSSAAMLTDSDYVYDIMNKAYMGVIPMLNIGSPRTDILFSKDEGLYRQLKLKLGLPLDKKIVMYAPTWRTSVQDSGVTQINNMDIPKLLQKIRDKFGGDWVFVLRVHQNVLLEVLQSNLFSALGDKVINGNVHDDMAEYLFCADILITDYSGSIYDVALTDKPCFLFGHDINAFENNRGFYMSMSFFPYSFSITFDDLLDSIANYDKNLSEEKRIDFLQRIGNKNDGHSAERAAKYLLKIIE